MIALPTHRRRAFSLVELMIAIVLLGLGMIFVATLFPVAWTQARQMNEITAMPAVTKAAETTVRLLARVDGRNVSGSSFAGDSVWLYPNELPMGPPEWVPQPITMGALQRVHALNVENILVSPREIVAEQPSDRDRLDGLDIDVPAIAGWGRDFVEEKLFTSPQVRLESRLHPPLPRPRNSLLFTDADPEWDDLLSTRRYLWAVLHRLRNQIVDEDQRREFDVFYVMLRRPQPTSRYAQQDTNPLRVPSPTDPMAVAPAPLPPENDCMFPVPWRVQVFLTQPIPDPTNPSNLPRNLPSEAAVNFPQAQATSSILVGMFPQGAYFVDETTGLVLRVEKRRVVEGPTGEHAFLTLDREIVTSDTLSNSSQLRTVWVFPPAVQARAADNDRLVFEGLHPVVGIERRSLALSPPS
jgi:prepilin-type N-terminal cleavage/methylation domain-containing protein